MSQAPHRSSSSESHSSDTSNIIPSNTIKGGLFGIGE
jgi:hypothetical protein